MLAMLDKPGFLLVALAGILIFGAKRLPDSARSLGRSMRILKAETKGLREDDVVVKKVELPSEPVTTTQV
jgi:sec-independent protein translocase protein TatA